MTDETKTCAARADEGTGDEAGLWPRTCTRAAEHGGPHADSYGAWFLGVDGRPANVSQVDAARAGQETRAAVELGSVRARAALIESAFVAARPAEHDVAVSTSALGVRLREQEALIEIPSAPHARWLCAFGVRLDDDPALVLKAVVHSAVKIEVDYQVCLQLPLTRFFVQEVEDETGKHTQLYELWKWIAVPAGALLAVRVTTYVPLPASGIGVVFVARIATKKDPAA